jgi:hypothetical protein
MRLLQGDYMKSIYEVTSSDIAQTPGFFKLVWFVDKVSVEGRENLFSFDSESNKKIDIL